MKVTTDLHVDEDSLPQMNQTYMKLRLFVEYPGILATLGASYGWHFTYK